MSAGYSVPHYGASSFSIAQNFRLPVRCVELDGGTRFLRTPQGDEWRYMPERYAVIAKAYGGFRPM